MSSDVTTSVRDVKASLLESVPSCSCVVRYCDCRGEVVVPAFPVVPPPPG